jgi:MerR family mercuric resistance operon transcriptional regulator
VAEVRRKIADLRRLERVMTDVAAQCTGQRIPKCPVIDALFDGRPLACRRSGGSRTRPVKAGSAKRARQS